MATYLVDYENVHYKGLEGIEHLTKKDTVIVFYSQAMNKVTFSVYKDIRSSKATFKHIFAHTGVINSLDMQLSSYLGALIAIRDDSKFFIVSKDRCFDYVVKFWLEREIDIVRVVDIKMTILEKTSFAEKVKAKLSLLNKTADTTSKESAKATIQEYISPTKNSSDEITSNSTPKKKKKKKKKQKTIQTNLTMSDIEQAVNPTGIDVQHYQTIFDIVSTGKTKCQVNTAIVRAFGSTNNIYSSIKPLIKHLPGS